VQVTVDRGSRHWRGNIGVVTTLIERGGFNAKNTVAMLCGPELMMRFAALALQQHGVSRDRIYVSLERNMQCGAGHCGHCQLGPFLLCRDGPVFRLDQVDALMTVQEF
jgi:NAD(P)H-flavin reductase